MKSVSVFIPMYNEETNAGILLPLLQRALARFTSDYEIVVVDDASRDRTVSLVEDYMSRDPRIRIVRHERNLGYGAALRTGFRSVTKEIVWYTDADVPIDFGVLDQVLPEMEKHPVIIGYRIDRHDTCGGRIVNIASIAGLVPLRLQSAYVAAKAGVVNLTVHGLELGGTAS